MKLSLRVILISATVAAVSHAAPFMAIGDGAELFATGRIGVRADDNILLTGDTRKLEDVILEVAPGLELTFGKNAQLQGSLTLVDTFNFYATNSYYDTQLFAGNFVTKYDDAKMKMGFHAGFNELNQNTVELRGLVRRDVTTAGVNGELNVSELTSVGAALNYTHENYRPRGYVDSDLVSVPLNFYYRWTPKLDAALGYTYSEYEAEGAALDSKDHFYNVGLRGEFSPKLTGKVAVGLVRREFQQNNAGSKNMFGLDASLAYELTPKSAIQFGASNQFGTSPRGQQQENLTINVLATTKLTEELSLNAGVSYRGIGYDAVRTGTVLTTPSRTDDYYEVVLGGAYVVNANLRIVGGYTYRTYESDLRGSDFENNVFSFAANIRY